MPSDAAVDRPPESNLSICLYTHYQYVYAPDPLLTKSRHQAMKALMAKAAAQELSQQNWTHTVTITLKKLGQRFVPGTSTSRGKKSDDWRSPVRGALSSSLDISVRR